MGKYLYILNISKNLLFVELLISNKYLYLFYVNKKFRSLCSLTIHLFLNYLLNVLYFIMIIIL